MAGGRVLTALGEDPVWYPAHMWQFATASNSASRGYDSLVWFPQALHTWGTCTHTGSHKSTEYIYIYIAKVGETIQS